MPGGADALMVTFGTLSVPMVTFGTLLLGAAGYRADSPVAKASRDLGGLLYADGIHDNLYRSAGTHHTTPAVPQPRPQPQPIATPA